MAALPAEMPTCGNGGLVFPVQNALLTLLVLHTKADAYTTGECPIFGSVRHLLDQQRHPDTSTTPTYVASSFYTCTKTLQLVSPNAC